MATAAAALYGVDTERNKRRRSTRMSCSDSVQGSGYPHLAIESDSDARYDSVAACTYMPDRRPGSSRKPNPIDLPADQSRDLAEQHQPAAPGTARRTAALPYAPSSEFKMKIHIKVLCEPRTRELEVQSSDTVASVKARIPPEVQVHMQLLIFNRQLLQDDKTLAHYKIQEGDSIYLTVNMKGYVLD